MTQDTTVGSYWICSNCGARIPYGVSHVCSWNGANYPQITTDVQAQTLLMLLSINQKLDAILKALEAMK